MNPSEPTRSPTSLEGRRILVTGGAQGLGEAISARIVDLGGQVLIADVLVTAGVDHIITMTLHSPQVHGFFSVPTDHLADRYVFARYLSESDLRRSVIVAPDMGHAKQASKLGSTACALTRCSTRLHQLVFLAFLLILYGIGEAAFLRDGALIFLFEICRSATGSIPSNTAAPTRFGLDARSLFSRTLGVAFPEFSVLPEVCLQVDKCISEIRCCSHLLRHALISILQAGTVSNHKVSDRKIGLGDITPNARLRANHCAIRASNSTATGRCSSSTLA